jgi:hypothetical protein
MNSARSVYSFFALIINRAGSQIDSIELVFALINFRRTLGVWQLTLAIFPMRLRQCGENDEIFYAFACFLGFELISPHTKSVQIQ